MRSKISGGPTLEPRLHARHVELGRGEQAAELVVQFAGEPAALVFAHRLQMAGQLGEVACAPLDLVLEPVAFVLQLRALLVARGVERPRLAHGEREQQQADQHQARRCPRG